MILPGAVKLIIEALRASGFAGLNGRLRQFTDDGMLRGAYRPRFRRCHSRGLAVDQLAQVRQLVCEEPDARREAVCLFDPGRDFAGARTQPGRRNPRLRAQAPRRRRRRNHHDSANSAAAAARRIPSCVGAGGSRAA